MNHLIQSWLKSNENGIANVFSEAEVVSSSGVSVGGVNGGHDLGVVPHVVLGDALSQLSNVKEDGSLGLQSVQVILKVLAVTENEGGLTVDLTSQLDSLEETWETEGFNIADEILNVSDQEITIDRASLNLFQVVFLDNSSHETGEGCDGLRGTKSVSGEGKGWNDNQGEKLVHSLII